MMDFAIYQCLAHGKIEELRNEKYGRKAHQVKSLRKIN
jgi:hypothetical protein